MGVVWRLVLSSDPEDAPEDDEVLTGLRPDRAGDGFVDEDAADRLPGLPDGRA